MRLYGRPWTEVLVCRQDGEFRATEPVYWSGVRIAEGASIGGSVEDAASICSNP